MKSIKFRMTGTCPLMLNNPQTVNPMNEFTKAISSRKQIFSLQTETTESRHQARTSIKSSIY